jgi:SAM-dependent methyltransferase
MGTIQENRDHWNRYSWPAGGDEWSEVWGGARFQWWGALYPRLMRFLPTGTTLEIAPGFGRFTQFLLPLCNRLIGVDLAEKCVDECRRRFSEWKRASFHVNNGLTLPMVEDASVDFAFSFDSLVHAEAEVLRSYLHELSSKLAPHGLAFIHHSNIGAFADAETGRIPFDNLHWRAESCSAEAVRGFCAEASLSCLRQEIVNWGGSELTDAFSMVTRPGSRWDRPLELRENPGFMAEAENIGALARLYGQV